MIRVGIVGYGYWGPNLVRNFAQSAHAKVVAVCDQRKDRLDLLSRRHPEIEARADVQELITDPSIDAIVIATPVATHYDIAKRSLMAGKHVLVSKPMVASLDEARDLVSVAASRRQTLMVDHTFVYTPAIRKIHELTTNGTLGDLYYYDSVRVNLGLFQHDVNVVWDLAVHDLSILDYILPARPTAIGAVGVKHFEGGLEDVAYLTVYYPNNLIAHVNVNWLAPVKVRLTLLGGSNRMIVYDDLLNVDKLKVYDSGVSVSGREHMYEMLVNYRTGDMWSPRLETVEALQSEVVHFLHCIETGDEPVSGGRAGLRTVAALEAANRSMAAGGGAVAIAEESW